MKIAMENVIGQTEQRPCVGSRAQSQGKVDEKHAAVHTIGWKVEAVEQAACASAYIDTGLEED